MNDNEEVPRYGPGEVLITGKATLTSTATTELHRLLDLLADTSGAASDLLRKAGRSPVGAELDRLREMASRINAMVERIKAILS